MPFKESACQAQYLHSSLVMESMVKKSEMIRLWPGNESELLYPEELFRTLLILERKRSERSNRKFLFVAIDMQNALRRERSDGKTVKSLLRAVFASSREVDIKGWYQDPECIGIIYTEARQDAFEKILGKIRRAIDESLPEGVGSSIDITYSIFPEENGKQWTPETLLYPQVHSKKLLRKIPAAVKRGIDVTLSGIVVMLLLPLFIVVALAVALTSPGPVFFKQERIGMGGKRFQLYKFRSMYVNNSSTIHREFVKQLIAGKAHRAGDETVHYKLKDDPRVTKLGRFLRKTSIDELPQLFNVLKGDMSLVGPRPPIDYEVEAYKVWHRSRVMEARPGITGLWQVLGRSRTTFEGMVRMDLSYIRHWSLWLDIKLLLRTPVAVISRKGAY
jgi:lipopolysaccharide/colanic/teichoic acid biosynthesis glycosyltransferase